jgi:nicotinamidase-related amidase/predicted transcriptional regulator
MRNSIIVILCTFILSCSAQIDKKAKIHTNEEAIGLMIIDAQKWFIPGHPESVYTRWNITGHNRTSETIISSMYSVLKWANRKKIPVFVTYEAYDTGQYNLPTELLEDLDSTRTTHYVKLFYGALKHNEFNTMVQSSNINHWILIGAETDVCVYQTTKELLKQKKHVTLIKEAIYSGRNNTEISQKSLSSFGANFIRLKELYLGTNLFNTSPPSVERNFDFSNTVLTVFPNSPNNSFSNGDSKRLEYLIQYANIIGLKTENPTSVSSNSKTRLIAGNITKEKYDELKKRTNDELIILADCTPLNTEEIPNDWRIHTLKSVFYELMETAEFYSKSIDELEGWQKELKKAIQEERLGYVETLQNK